MKARFWHFFSPKKCSRALPRSRRVTVVFRGTICCLIFSSGVCLRQSSDAERGSRFRSAEVTVSVGCQVRGCALNLMLRVVTWGQSCFSGRVVGRIFFSSVQLYDYTTRFCVTPEQNLAATIETIDIRNISLGYERKGARNSPDRAQTILWYQD